MSQYQAAGEGLSLTFWLELKERLMPKSGWRFVSPGQSCKAGRLKLAVKFGLFVSFEIFEKCICVRAMIGGDDGLSPGGD